MSAFGSLHTLLAVHPPPPAFPLLGHLARELARLPAARTKFPPLRYRAAGVGITGLGIQPVLKIANAFHTRRTFVQILVLHTPPLSHNVQYLNLCLPLSPSLLQPLDSLSRPILNDVRRKNLPSQLRRRQGRRSRPIQICRPR